MKDYEKFAGQHLFVGGVLLGVASVGVASVNLFFDIPNWMFFTTGIIFCVLGCYYLRKAMTHKLIRRENEI